MNQISYGVKQPEIFTASTSFLLSNTPALPNNDRATVISHRKLLCMTLSKPTEVRVLSRNGTKSDSTLSVPIRRLLSTENYRSHSLLFFGVSDHDVVILSPSIQPSGNIAISPKYVPLKEDVFSMVPGRQSHLVALGKSNIFVIDENSGNILNTIPHQEKVSAGADVAYHEDSNLLVFPSKNTLTIFSLDSKMNVLAKPWEPHTLPTTFTKIFQNRKVSLEGNKDELLILTASRNNSELRFWIFNTSTKRSTLKEEMTIEGGDKETGELLNFDISVTSSEDYITLCSKANSIAIIVELNHEQFKPGKITTWRTPGASLCSCAQLAKINVEKADVRMSLILTVRTTEGFHQLIIDEAKISSDNGGALMDASSNWFSPEATKTVSSLASHSPQRLLSVSSSLQGDCKALAVAAETNAATVVRDQAFSTTNELQRVERDVADIHGFMTQLRRIFEGKDFEKMADRLGKEFAERNKGRLVLKIPPSPTFKPLEKADMIEGALTESQKELNVIIRQYADSLRSLSLITSEKILKTRLQRALQAAVKEAKESLCNYDATGSSQMYVSDSVLIKDVQECINTLVGDVKGLLKVFNSESQSNSIFASSMNQVNTMTDQYLVKVRAEVGKIKEEIRQTKDLAAKIDIIEEVPIDPGAILSNCISVGQSGDWAGALRAALHASDTSILLNFLESEACQENMDTLTHPNRIEMADFLSLCLQLSFEIETVPGAIPSRLDYLHRFFVKWDDYLQETKKRAPQDDRCAAILKLIVTEFNRVLLSLEPIDLKSLPRSSRSHCLLTRKIIASFIR